MLKYQKAGAYCEWILDWKVKSSQIIFFPVTYKNQLLLCRGLSLAEEREGKITLLRLPQAHIKHQKCHKLCSVEM